MTYEWVSPILSFTGGLVGSVATLTIGLNNFKLNKKSLQQQRIINKMNLKNAKKINDQNLKAEVVVKSRMEWIKDVRDMNRRFISLHTKQLSNINILITYSNEFNRYQTKAITETHSTDSHQNVQRLKENIDIYKAESEKIGQHITNLDKEFNSNLIEFAKIQFEFFNYFPTKNIDGTENTDNLEIINKLQACIESIDVLRDKWQKEIQNKHLNNDIEDYLSGVKEIGHEFRTDVLETNRDIDIFSDTITAYLKKEWEKVKRIE
ncbi:hypothetical protein BU055_11475 [Staphylococcus succinus]|uniref:hypothetical protein n=1 Tax=Staphylococcus succinus TaxID=61015 RepID=UPI000D1DE5EB|nr:hypothetical protein [Staphylococcus succinus]PTJ81251.1 hypothetical protein BU055_11475 [Staphylococcus succinus]